MRVVHISKVKGIAGSERHLLALLPELARQGVEVSMLVLEDPRQPADGFSGALEESSVPVRRVAIYGHVDPSLPERLSVHLRALAPDILHTHLLHADLYGLYAAEKASIPCAVSTRHNDNPFRRNPILRWINRRTMRRAKRVIAISNALARFVSEVEGIEAGRIVTIHYGLDPLAAPHANRAAARAELGCDGSGPVVGFFGRLVRQKGVDILLRAFARVRRLFPAARLVIVGDGEERPGLEALARDLGLASVASFAGWIEDAPRLMAACDLIAMPSRWEGFGLVALEAMSAARPLAASRVSALPEIVMEGKTGLLVPPEDPDALAEAVSYLLADPARAAAMGRAGYERLVHDFSVEKMVRATLDVYDAVVGQPAPLPRASREAS